MEITFDRLFLLARKGLFFFLLMTTVLQIISAAHSESINYYIYCALLTDMVALCYALLAIQRKEGIVFNWMIIYFAYRFLNVIFVRGFPGGFAASYLLLVNTIIGLGFYFLLYHNERKDVFRFCVIALVGLGVFEACIGISQATTGEPYFENLVGEELHTFNRNYFAYIFPGGAKSTVLGSGTFRHFNALGSFLVVVFPIAYALWYESRKRLALFALVAIFLGIVFTFSRGALIGTFLMYTILYFSFTKDRWMKMGLIVAGGLIILASIAPLLISYANETGNATIRFNTWMEMWKHAKTDYRMLVFGWGENYFRDRVLNWGHGVWIMNNTHNTFFQTLLENGVVGFLIFGIAIGQFIFKAIRFKNIWAYAGIAMIVGFAFSQFFEHTFYGFVGTIFFAVLGFLQIAMQASFTYADDSKELKENKNLTEQSESLKDMVEK
ncbi:O-antigen ligase family protein [Persicobacter diffluens]